MRFFRHVLGVLLLTAICSFSGCGKKGISLSENCRIKDDQKSSFLAPLDVKFPVQVALDDRFSEPQKTQILTAISVWNRFSKSYYGVSFFSPGIQSISASSLPSSDDDCSFDGGASESFFKIIKEESDERWSALHLSAANGGATIRCTYGDKLTKQVVVINPNTANSSQFLSVVLHELGHVLGLGHSCTEGAGSRDYAGCSNLDSEHPYRLAVMYPLLGLTASLFPETKEYLRTNDMDRTACLYDQ